MRERNRSSAKSRAKLKNRRTCAYVRNAEELRFGALLLKKLGMGTNLQSANATAVLGDGGAEVEAGEMSARSQFGAMRVSTHNSNARSRFLTATISAGPLAASPGPGHSYHPT